MFNFLNRVKKILFPFPHNSNNGRESTSEVQDKNEGEMTHQRGVESENKKGNTNYEEIMGSLISLLGSAKTINEQDNKSRTLGFGRDNFNELTERDKQYTSLLSFFCQQYLSRQTNKEEAKWDFYANIMSLFYIILFVLLIIVVVLAFSAYNKGINSTIPAIITAITGIVTALIAIPTIVAKYLFNPDEDKDVTKLILKMQAQDVKNRKGFSKESHIEEDVKDND